jgi:FHS family L-fucose permease-like MFS transporter
MRLPFILVTSLFFLWGVPNNLNDVLIRQFMKSFAISRFQAGLVQSAFYMGYFLLATPAALLMRKYGYKAGFLAGLCLLGAGALLFWPAAIVARYSFFLFALFVIASGLSFLETAANPFIAQLGDGTGGARRLNFSQAFNPLGSILGVLVGTVFIFSGVELKDPQIAAMKASHTYEAYLRHETLRVVDPYLALGAVAFLLAFLIWRTTFPVVAGEEGTTASNHGHFSDLLRYPHFSVGDRCAVHVCRRASGHMELFHPVCTGLDSSAGKSSRILSHWNTGRLWRGPLLLFGADEVRETGPIDGRL